MAGDTPCQLPISMQQLGLTKQQLPLTLAFDYLLAINRNWVSRKESKVLDTSNSGNPSESNITGLGYWASFWNTWEWENIMSNNRSFLQQEEVDAFTKWRLGYFQIHVQSYWKHDVSALEVPLDSTVINWESLLKKEDSISKIHCHAFPLPNDTQAKTNNNNNKNLQVHHFASCHVS